MSNHNNQSSPNTSNARGRRITINDGYSPKEKRGYQPLDSTQSAPPPPPESGSNVSPPPSDNKK